MIRVPSFKQKESYPLTPNKTQKNNVTSVTHGKLLLEGN